MDKSAVRCICAFQIRVKNELVNVSPAVSWVSGIGLIVMYSNCVVVLLGPGAPGLLPVLKSTWATYIIHASVLRGLCSI